MIHDECCIQMEFLNIIQDPHNVTFTLILCEYYNTQNASNFLKFRLNSKIFFNRSSGHWPSPQKKRSPLKSSKKYKKIIKNGKAQNTVYVKFPVTKMLLTSSKINQNQNFFKNEAQTSGYLLINPDILSEAPKIRKIRKKIRKNKTRFVQNNSLHLLGESAYPLILLNISQQLMRL